MSTALAVECYAITLARVKVPRAEKEEGGLEGRLRSGDRCRCAGATLNSYIVTYTALSSSSSSSSGCDVGTGKGRAPATTMTVTMTTRDAAILSRI